MPQDRLTKKAGLFQQSLEPRICPITPDTPFLKYEAKGANAVSSPYKPRVNDELIELFERVPDPTDGAALFALFKARIRHKHPEFNDHITDKWGSIRKVRCISEDEILRSAGTVDLVKEIFNYFFRDDLYGRLRNDDTLIFSSGSVCEETFGLSSVGKAAVQYALDRDWYGYSDSTGRTSAREAIAELENLRLGQTAYDANQIAVTLGATHAINTLSELFLSGVHKTCGEALIGIPNYPPLVKSISRRCPTKLVPLECENGCFSADLLTERLSSDTPLVMLQSVANPTGAVVSEESLIRLIHAASPNTMIIIDECHEFLGPQNPPSVERNAPNVVRVASLSKVWSVPGMKIGWIMADQAVIRDFYEVASTSYGGPPSLFFTLLEVFGRFEACRLRGDSPGSAELNEFASDYGLSLDALQRAHEVYVEDWTVRNQQLTKNRDALAQGLQNSGFQVIPPKYSINLLAFESTAMSESYPSFQSLMARANASTYPGIMNFCFGSNGLRFTSARRWEEIAKLFERLNS